IRREADCEEARVLEEERPLLGEEKTEAGEIDLLIVHLDLREVGVDRQVQDEALRDADLRVCADLERIADSRSYWWYSLRRAQSIWRHRHHPLGRWLQPGQRAGLRQTIEVELSGDRRPHDLLVL